MQRRRLTSSQALSLFEGTFDLEPARFKQTSKDVLRHLTYSLVRTKQHMAAVSDATADTGTDALTPWAFGKISLKAPNDPTALLHKVPHEIDDPVVRRECSQALETVAQRDDVALRCQVNDDPTHR